MNRIIFALSLMLISLSAFAQFDSVFYNKSLRLDYTHGGTATQEWVMLEQLSELPHWAGSKTQLIDSLRYGKYFFELLDPATDSVLYSRGYGSLFSEWQTTTEAQQIARSFSETILMPFPKETARLLIYSRNFNGNWDTIFKLKIDPDSYFIKPAAAPKWPVMNVYGDNPPEKAVDIVILPDGYTMDELGKFIEDVNFFKESLFAFEPYASMRDKFNIRAVLAPSEQAGIAIPAEDIWPETALSSHFYTFDSERYCMSYDNKSIRDLAGHVPYDQIYILANTTKYGGGGIYNFYALSTAGNQLSSKIIVHEFGHSFAGLADEYFDSSTSYNDFYNLEVEPWEPNLTTLVDFDSKWKDLLLPGTAVPTIANDSMTAVLGVYEGGGYVAKGMFRPKMDCLMHTFKEEIFCGACNRAIIRMIRFYSE